MLMKEPYTEQKPAYGNLVPKTIKLYPGEGLVIEWARPDFMRTTIDSTGDEKPLYDHLVNVVLGLSASDKSKGVTILARNLPPLHIESNDTGNIMAIGEWGKELVSIKEEPGSQD
jgi:hypothetical protein